MNVADQAIEEIREVRRRISAEFGHDITKYLAILREAEKGHTEQIQRGKDLLARRDAEQKCQEAKNKPRALRDVPVTAEAVKAL